MPLFKVGVFHHEGKRKRRYSAYTTWFSPTWPGVRVYSVVAANGTEAKAAAIACARIEDVVEKLREMRAAFPKPGGADVP